MQRIRRRTFLAGLGASAAALTTGGLHGMAAPRRKPNIVFILIDDLGWADVGCYGSTYYQTPTIDRLAGEGMKFTDAYAACPVCSPTRASILTGKYPARLGITDFIPGHQRPYEKLDVPVNRTQHLPLDEVTIPEMLKGAGYVSACFGKWHLGWAPKHTPTAQGFDVNKPAKNQNDKQVASLTDLAIQFIEDSKDQPFFLYLSHHTVHIRLEASQELIDKHTARLKPGQKPPQQANPKYAAMMDHLDTNIERILKKLDELKLADDTMVIFYSDNGGLRQIYTGDGEIVTSNAPLRDEKGTLYEGGIRVPLIVRWPGRIKPGSTCGVPVTSTDLLPTFAEIAGVKTTPTGDGESIVGLLKQRGKPKRKAIYWHYPVYHHSTPAGAVRMGDWKLIEFFGGGRRLELYNLADDIGEKKNLAVKHPAKAAELHGALIAWRRSVGAAMPTPNPNHDPARAAEWGPRKWGPSGPPSWIRKKPKPRKP